jgi:hypothetical protein
MASICDPNQLSKEAYTADLPKLRSRFPTGFYALYVGAALVGAFASYSDALTEGYNAAGMAPFFVKQISSVEEVQCVVTPIIVG